MLLKNWYKLLARVFSNTADENTHATNTDGSKGSASAANSSANNGGCCLSPTVQSSMAPYMGWPRAGYANAGGVVFGNGSGPVSFDDYKLSGDVHTNFSASNVTPTITTDENGVTLTALYTITNTGDAEMVISEIGLLACRAQVSSAAWSVLVEHTVLDTPVTIAAGGVGQVTYTIRMNYPT